MAKTLRTWCGVSFKKSMRAADTKLYVRNITSVDGRTELNCSQHFNHFDHPSEIFDEANCTK